MPDTQCQDEGQNSGIDWEAVGQGAAEVGLFAGGLAAIAFGAVKMLKHGDPTLFNKGLNMTGFA